jgi:hypothetical protein
MLDDLSQLSFLSLTRSVWRMSDAPGISLVFRSVFSMALASKWYLTEKGVHQTRDRTLTKRLLIISASHDSHGESGRHDLGEKLRSDLFKFPMPAWRFFFFSFLLLSRLLSLHRLFYN